VLSSALKLGIGFSLEAYYMEHQRKPFEMETALCHLVTLNLPHEAKVLVEAWWHHY
jgi:hypothetical protein